MPTTPTHAELLLPDDLCEFDAVSDLEEPLDRGLIAARIGEVVGGGIGSGWYRFDLVVSDFAAATRLLRASASELGLPPGSCLRLKDSVETVEIVAAE